MSFENSSPLIEQPAPSELSFLIASGVTVTVGQVVYVSAAGSISPTTGIQDFVGVVKSLGNVSAIYGNRKATVISGKSKVRVTAYGTINPGDQVVSGPGGTMQTLPPAAAADEITSAGTATSITNHGFRKAICDTGANSGGTAVIVLL